MFRKLVVLSPIFYLIAIWPGLAHSEFELNFVPVQNPATVSDFPKGGYGNTGQAILCPDAANPDCLNGTEPSTDPTPFFYERVDGYWHMIIGDTDSGFVQETYIPIIGLFHSYSGGREPVFFTLNGNLEQWSGNGWDPLGATYDTYGPDNSSYTGNGTGDPTKVTIRQILGPGSLSSTGVEVETWSCAGGAFCQEFLKSQEAFKPIIRQDYNDGVLMMNFELDMSAISYTDNTTAAVFTNILEINDPDLPPSNTVGATAPAPNRFDMSVDSQNSTVSAGKYTYVAGISWYDDGDGDLYRAYGEGTYEYESGTSGFQMGIDWNALFDSNQNAPGVHPGNESRCAAENLVVCDAPPVIY